MSAHDVFDAAVAAYAIDALDKGERLEFEAHLATCDVCQRELAEWRRVSGVIGAAVEPVDPPASLKARTIARAVSVPQERSRPAPATVARLPVKAPAVRRSSLSWLAAAAAIVTVVGLGAYAMALRSQVAVLRAAVANASLRAETLRAEMNALRRDSVRLTYTLGILSAPDLMRVDLRGQATAPAAMGRVYLSNARGLVFAANGLPALTPDQIYQLWVIPPGSTTPVSAGVFSVDASGSAAVSAQLPAEAGAVKTVAVSVEQGPNGSSAGPKGAILLMGSTS